MTSSTNSTLCITEFTQTLQSYLGTPLTNSFIDVTLLGGNSTSYNAVTSLVTNATMLKMIGCTDCVSSALDIVMENYPGLENMTIAIPDGILTNYTGNATYGMTNATTSMTIPMLFEGVCHIEVGPSKLTFTFPF